MDLSPELFEQIVTATGATVADAKTADRRSPRARTQVSLAVCGWDDPMSVLSLKVRDLSAGGVGLLHRERMKLDEQLVVRLPCDGGESVTVLGRVVYWEPLAPDLYAIGVHFDRIVSEEELALRANDGAATTAEAAGVIGRLTQALSWTWRKAS
jgi:hypothetical protein